ncbi:ATP-binding cassette domain-containing protein [Allopusillimonas ginsengisoli]|uniref:ABC transporter ATP-binding protein n=1 Tax=Allopusillimonas ginsengisoli TaxID=453575 RepID=UPI0010C20500|nr:ATP-binding cassette domain-containing protein [Allopusillimonas ginsengisoli]
MHPSIAPATAPSPRAPLLRAQQLAFQIEGRWLWRNLTLTLQPGERLGITGPSGGGKTLLLRTLAGLEPLQQGELEYRGRALTNWQMPAYRSRVAYIPQRPALHEGSVEAALRAPFNFRAHAHSTFPLDRAHELLAALGREEHFLQQRCERLSGGEAQIVALLRTLLLEPEVLLLDEPTASLDAITVTAIEQLIERWMAGTCERACVWTSHDSAQLQRTCDRQITLEPAQ